MRRARDAFLCMASAALAGWAGIAAAQPAGTGGVGEEDLLAVLAEETALATATRMNSDFVPGIVTVLHGDEMEALGARTVLEALAFVPGMVATQDSNGLPLLQVRGIDLGLGNGGVRILVDSRTLGREATGLSSATIMMPIEQVDRIEVLRGPGSLWGDFAFVGLVNIITRKDRSGAWAAGGSGGLATGGVAIGTDQVKSPVAVAANYSGWRALKGDYAEGAHGTDRRLYGNASATWKGWTLSAASVWRDIADFRPSGLPGRFRSSFERSETAELRYTYAPAADRRLSAYVSTLSQKYQINVDHYESHLAGGGLDGSYKVGPQRLTLKMDFAAAVIDEASHISPPQGPGRPGNLFTLRDIHQDYAGVMLQDEVEIGKRLTVTAGVRFDDQSDMRSHTSPRFAAVFRVSDEHTLKAQWAEGFRSVTFFQLYAGGTHRNFDFEASRTAELAWIFRRPTMTGKLTVFRVKLGGLFYVVVPNPATFRDAHATGVEAEWAQSLGDLVKVIANLSWVDTEDKRSPSGQPEDSFAEAEWLWNLGLLARPLPGLTAGVHWNHVGHRAAAPGSTTGLPGFEEVDLTFTWHPPSIPRMSFRAGVRNLLDEDVTGGLRLPNGLVTFTTAGRSYTFQSAYTF